MYLLQKGAIMDMIAEILGKIAEVSVTVGTIAKGLITFLGGIFVSRKLPPSSGS